MRKLFFTAILFTAAATAGAQNIQLHYDLGRNIYTDEEDGRQKVTVTLEQFKADEWGSWYYFVDLDLCRKSTQGAYTEISREINLGKESPFAVHAEYDGGLNLGGSFQQAALLGAAYNGHSDDYSKTWSIQALYKQYFKSADYTHSYASAQLTGVWGITFAAKALTLSGFIDFWRGEQANGHGQLVVLTEPQLWWNLNTLPGLKKTHLSIGTEVEVSNNFIYNTYNDKSFFINPTVALKWVF